MVDSKVPTDVYLRLRGIVKDSPLIVFRDFDGELERNQRLNLVFSLIDDIGEVVQARGGHSVIHRSICCLLRG